MNKCIVCKENFEDGWNHVLSGKGLLGPKDKQHADYIDEVTNSNYEKPCFCGGKIRTYGSVSSDGDASWETSCEKCNFLWNED